MIVLLSALLLAAAPSPAPLPTPAPALAKVQMPSFTAGQAVSVKLNQPFQIRLKVTSGTGYSWQPQAPLPPGIGLLGVFQQPRGKMMPGGPGMENLVFRAVDPGKYTLTLGYLRPWERNVKPAKTQTFTVTVHK
jgi:predicted secreted protein